MSKTIDEYGRVIIDSTDIMALLYSGGDLDDIFVTSEEKIIRFNELCDLKRKEECKLKEALPLEHTPEEEHSKRTAQWLIPDNDINVREYVVSKCNQQDEIDRANLEMDLFEQKNLLPVLKLMIYLVAHFRENNIIVGVGRGSSVASFVLFLIGVHKINSLKYNLDIKEFLK